MRSRKRNPNNKVTVFLMADAVTAAKAGQKTPDGYYNVERMLKRVVAGKGRVLLGGTCMEARGLDDAALMEGAHRSSMDELATATGLATTRTSTSSTKMTASTESSAARSALLSPCSWRRNCLHPAASCFSA